MAVLASQIVACAQSQVRLYDGPERTVAEIATVTLPEALEVEKINGAQVRGASGMLRKGDVDLQLVPGRYELLVYYKEIWNLGGSDDALRSDPARFVLDAQAGHHYRIEYAHPADYEAAKKLTASFSGWVDDTTTGQRVMSQDSGLQFKRGLAAQLSADHELERVAEKTDGQQVVQPLPVPTPGSVTATAPVPVSGRLPPVDASASNATSPAGSEGEWLPVMKSWWSQATPSERRAFLLWVGERTDSPSQP
ncbi:DUF2057 family protein [Sinimarinibacterium sp. CAU 1509]|uniref:DUF2057 family protein n=1 Tax=Sinimarinibacterium sp. CAU 1509 TaxID=2562283 RepID=UPI00200AC89D|nr:DUF2057 family protein [Sinimarinibacterium sp. CAU 1509]